MSWTINAALDDPLIDGPMVFLSEFKFSLKGISTEITIRLYRPHRGAGVIFDQSHFIHTPEQGTPYRTSRPQNDDEASALHQAISGMTRFYEIAVNKGHSPSSSWLVPNDSF